MSLNLVFMHRRFGGIGGVEHNALRLAGALAARGHRVTLLHARGGCEPPEGVTLRRVRVGRTPGLKYNAWDQAAQREAAAGGYDVSVGFDLVSRQDVIRAGRIVAGRRRAELDRLRGPFDRLATGMSLNRALRDRIERAMYGLEGHRRIVAVSGRIRDEIVETYGLPPERITVIHNGVDTVRFHPDRRRALRDEARRELGLPEGAPVLLFLGNDFRLKGLDVLLDALPAVRREIPEARLLVVGGDSRLPRFRDRARRGGVEAAVHFTGPRRDAERMFAAADAFVLSSRYETFGTVVMEAAAMGLPTVVTDAAGAAEVIAPAAPELVVPSESPEALAGACAAALTDALGEGRLGALCRGLAEQKDLAHNVDAWERVLREVAAQKAAGG